LISWWSEPGARPGAAGRGPEGRRGGNQVINKRTSEASGLLEGPEKDP
jgi:hypothetical protein